VLDLSVIIVAVDGLGGVDTGFGGEVSAVFISECFVVNVGIEKFPLVVILDGCTVVGISTAVEILFAVSFDG
jgi:hypothetical protein